ncbi:hypothetical protein ACLOJK_034896, partial [Asimina triloba]
MAHLKPLDPAIDHHKDDAECFLLRAISPSKSSKQHLFRRQLARVAIRPIQAVHQPAPPASALTPSRAYVAPMPASPTARANNATRLPPSIVPQPPTSAVASALPRHHRRHLRSPAAAAFIARNRLSSIESTARIVASSKSAMSATAWNVHSEPRQRPTSSSLITPSWLQYPPPAT